MPEITAWHWFALACLFFIVEMLIGTEFLLWLGIATSASALVAYFVSRYWVAATTYIVCIFYCCIAGHLEKNCKTRTCYRPAKPEF